MPTSVTRFLRRSRSACDAAVCDASRRGAVVFYDDGLTKQRSHPLGKDAADCIGRPACGSPYHECDRSGWIALRTKDGRHDRQRSSANGQVQKSAAVKLHSTLPDSFCDTSLPVQAMPCESAQGAAERPLLQLVLEGGRHLACGEAERDRTCRPGDADRLARNVGRHAAKIRCRAVRSGRPADLHELRRRAQRVRTSCRSWPIASDYITNS